MFDRTRRQPTWLVKTALILDDDSSEDNALRRMLGELGYETQVVTDASEALDVLRASADPIALLFDVEAYEETLDGRGYVTLIGALLEDPALAQRHIFAAISSSPEEVEWTLGKALARLHTPIFGKPCAATLEAYLTARRSIGESSSAETAPTL